MAKILKNYEITVINYLSLVSLYSLYPDLTHYYLFVLSFFSVLMYLLVKNSAIWEFLLKTRYLTPCQICLSNLSISVVCSL